MSQIGEPLIEEEVPAPMTVPETWPESVPEQVPATPATPVPEKEPVPA